MKVKDEVVSVFLVGTLFFELHWCSAQESSWIRYLSDHMQFEL